MHFGKLLFGRVQIFFCSGRERKYALLLLGKKSASPFVLISLFLFSLFFVVRMFSFLPKGLLLHLLLSSSDDLFLFDLFNKLVFQRVCSIQILGG